MTSGLDLLLLCRLSYKVAQRKSKGKRPAGQENQGPPPPPLSSRSGSEDYLHQVTNTRHRIALTKLRLSNHKLGIETGRYSRPFKKPAEIICPICKIEMEDEYHFLNICPAFQEKRCSLLDYLEKEYRIKISRMSPNKIFMFLINLPSGNVKIQKMTAEHIIRMF